MKRRERERKEERERERREIRKRREERKRRGREETREEEEEKKRRERREESYSLEVCKQMVCVLTDINPHTLTRVIRLTMLTLKLTSCSSVTRDVASIHGMVSNHADTYMMGADRNVLMTIPEVT